jgi:hypothetical protein
MRIFLLGSLVLFAFIVNVSAQSGPPAIPGEKHLKNVKQLSFGGENAEAYFSFDGKRLIFQSKRDNLGCDQIFTMTGRT